MLSFFSRKKQSPPETPTGGIIQGPASDAQQTNGDDFIFVEKRTPDQPNVYPHMPPPIYGAGGGFPYPMYPPAAENINTGNDSYNSSGGTNNPVPYVQGVPFTLSPQLCTKTAFEVTQLQVDGILAVMTRQMSVDEHDDYNFNLERSITN